MRGVYGAIFLGFAVVGFAGVFNAHNSARAATTSATPIDDESSTVQPATDPSSITIRTDLVHAAVVQPDLPPSVVARVVRRAVHRRAVQTSRSRLARAIFGDGQFRPQPFPTPAKN